MVRHRGLVILLESRFDKEADDYSDRYDVYVLSGISEDELQGSWEDLPSKATRFLGQVPVRDVEFDSTLRNEIDFGLIDVLKHGSTPTSIRAVSPEEATARSGGWSSDLAICQVSCWKLLCLSILIIVRSACLKGPP